MGLDEKVAGRLDLPEAWRGVTVRQLLNHTSGIPDYTARPDFVARLEEHLTPAGIVARTAALPLEFSSGTRFKYDNTGYVLLGMLVERLDGRSYGKALSARILRPLGMARTRLDAGGKPEAMGTTDGGKPALAIEMSQPYAAGSIVSTAEDMAKWLAAQGSPRLLPAALWGEAERSGVLADGKATRYGFGWVLGAQNGVPTLEHGGGIPGFASYVLRAPSKGVGVVVLTDSDAGKPAEVARLLLATAELALKEPDAVIPNPDPAVTAATEAFLRDIEAGTPDRSKMGDALAGLLTPEAVAGAKGFLLSLGSFRSLRLVAVDGGRRTYKAVYGTRTVTVRIARDAEGRFTSFAITPA